jgi:hypothetical protein
VNSFLQASRAASSTFVSFGAMTTMSTQESNEVNRIAAKSGDISLNPAQVCVFSAV